MALRLLTFPLLLVLAASVPAQSGFLIKELSVGKDTAANFGHALAVLGDVDGDTIPDYAAAAPDLDVTGAVYVYSGASGAALYELNGPPTVKSFGDALGGGGDVDGDGFGDLIVGSRFANSNQGFFQVYSGDDGALLFERDGLAGSELGYSVAIIPDVDGDGLADFAAGAPGSAPGGLIDAGTVFLYSSTDGSLLRQFDGGIGDLGFGDRLGTEVRGMDDATGDGSGDLLIGAPHTDPNGTSSGSAALYNGGDGALVHEWEGEDAGEAFGWSIATPGDLNGDAIDDFVISSYAKTVSGQGSVGAVTVFSGADFSEQAEIEGSPDQGLFFGQDVDLAGDVDGDGRTDLVIGSHLAVIPGNPLPLGAIWVYSGVPAMGLIWQMNAASEQYLGFAVAGLGDVDGDGRSEVLAGAPRTDFGAQSEAGVVFTLGSPLSHVLSVTELTEGVQARFRIQAATPNTEILLAYSLVGGGPWNFLWGVALLTPPLHSMPKITTDGSGFGRRLLKVPLGTAGQQVWFQAYDVIADQLSNGITRVVN